MRLICRRLAVLVSVVLSGCVGAAVSGAEPDFKGHAHWYGGQFHGRRTASGIVFDKHKFTAAHPSLPFGTKVAVRSIHTGKSVIVTINDRCPHMKQRCIDLSEGAAKEIGIYPAAPGKVECSLVNRKRELAGNNAAESLH